MKAEDLKPSRLEKAKLEIRNLIGRLHGDRIGLIVFAGDAYVQFPLTTDYGAANLFLDAVDVDAVPLPGTNIAAAISRALESFALEGEEASGQNAAPVLVIITDGENTEGEVLESAEEAARKSVLIYTIGMGSPAGSPIPVYGSSGRQVDFKRDRKGNVVISKLDELSLEKIANIGRGVYFRGTTGQDELEEISKSISALQKREYGVKQFTDFEDRYQWFLLAAVLVLIAEVLLADRRSSWIARWNPLQRVEEVIS
jgi:Ca-activated chloride channel family protein